MSCCQSDNDALMVDSNGCFYCDTIPKVKGRFGLAWVSESPDCPCPEPVGWQVEFLDTPSKVEQKCQEMVRWINCPPLPRCDPCPPDELCSPCNPPRCNPCAPKCNPCLPKCPLPKCTCKQQQQSCSPCCKSRESREQKKCCCCCQKKREKRTCFPNMGGPCCRNRSPRRRSPQKCCCSNDQELPKCTCDDIPVKDTNNFVNGSSSGTYNIYTPNSVINQYAPKQVTRTDSYDEECNCSNCSGNTLTIYKNNNQINTDTDYYDSCNDDYDQTTPKNSPKSPQNQQNYNYDSNMKELINPPIRKQPQNRSREYNIAQYSVPQTGLYANTVPPTLPSYIDNNSVRNTIPRSAGTPSPSFANINENDLNNPNYTNRNFIENNMNKFMNDNANNMDPNMMNNNLVYINSNMRNNNFNNMNTNMMNVNDLCCCNNKRPQSSERDYRNYDSDFNQQQRQAQRSQLDAIEQQSKQQPRMMEQQRPTQQLLPCGCDAPVYCTRSMCSKLNNNYNKNQASRYANGNINQKNPNVDGDYNSNTKYKCAFNKDQLCRSSECNIQLRKGQDAKKNRIEEQASKRNLYHSCQEECDRLGKTCNIDNCDILHKDNVLETRSDLNRRIKEDDITPSEFSVHSGRSAKSDRSVKSIHSEKSVKSEKTAQNPAKTRRSKSNSLSKALLEENENNAQKLPDIQPKPSDEVKDTSRKSIKSTKSNKSVKSSKLSKDKSLEVIGGVPNRSSTSKSYHTAQEKFDSKSQTDILKSVPSNQIVARTSKTDVQEEVVKRETAELMAAPPSSPTSRRKWFNAGWMKCFKNRDTAPDAKLVTKPILEENTEQNYD